MSFLKTLCTSIGGTKKGEGTMTCIVGLIENGVVYMGADSLATRENDSWSATPRLDPKVFQRDEMLIGVSGTARVCQLLQYTLVVPRLIDGQDVFAYICSSLIPAIRECLKEGGISLKKDDAESFEGRILIGCKGRLIYIDSDYQVAEPITNFHAIGCADETARGAMYVSQDKLPKERILKALEAAEYFSAAVRRPFLIMTSPSTVCSP